MNRAWGLSCIGFLSLGLGFRASGQGLPEAEHPRPNTRSLSHRQSRCRKGVKLLAEENTWLRCDPS